MKTRNKIILPKKKKHQRKQRGLPPGSLVYTGTHKDTALLLSKTRYNDNLTETKEITVAELLATKSDDNVVQWIDLVGLYDIDRITAIGEKFGIHQLQLEDMVNTAHRPKAEVDDNSIFVIFKIIKRINGEIDEEQISLYLKENMLFSFQEHEGDVFDPIRERIKMAAGRIRSRKADFLMYALIDVVVDSYFEVLEEIGNRQEQIEDDLAASADRQILLSIRESKSELNNMRKAVLPLREAVSTIIRGTSNNLCEESTIRYFQDVQDHLIQMAELIESAREINNDMREIYLSTMSNRMNEIMKVLTVISTIFIPLSFVAGVYGTNFEHVPEYTWPYGYGYFWLVCSLIIFVMVSYFKRKKWF